MKNPEKSSSRPGRRAGQSRSEMQCVAFLRRDALLQQLHALVSGGAIGHFWCVEHEPDEETKKPHFHLRLTPPPSRAVVWSEIAASIYENVPGETLPRKLVLGKRAVNDESEEGLLYARHDSRFLSVKGLTKGHVDYPRTAFFTDSPEWLDGEWAKADDYTPTPRKMSAEDILSELERNPKMPARILLRLCIVNNLNQGQLTMLERYRSVLLADLPPPMSAETARSVSEPYPEDLKPKESEIPHIDD